MKKKKNTPKKKKIKDNTAASCIKNRQEVDFFLAMVATWAQFHRAAKHNHLLSMKFLLGNNKYNQPNFHDCIPKNKKYVTNGNFVGNPGFFFKKEISC